MAMDWSNTKEYFITYSILIDAARHQGITTYQEIAQACGLPTAGAFMGSVVGQILGVISQNELAHNRPMLSAIAFGVTGAPGEGFFNWAKELGVMKAEEEKGSFLSRERERIYEVWKVPYRISKSKI